MQAQQNNEQALANIGTPPTHNPIPREQRLEALKNEMQARAEKPEAPPAEPPTPAETKQEAAAPVVATEAPPAPADDAELIKDPEVAKRLAIIEKAEARKRDQLAAKEAEIAKRAKDLEEMSERVAKFESLSKRVKYDPAAVLEALGLEDMDFGARQVFSRSKTALADPKNRDAAERLAREREVYDEVQKTRQELTEMREMLLMAEATQSAAAYVSSVKAEAQKAEAPYAKRFIENAKERADREIDRIASKLLGERNQMPSASEVLAELDKEARETISLYGVDPKVALAPQAPPPSVSRSIAMPVAPPTRPREERKMTRDELREQIIRDFKFEQ